MASPEVALAGERRPKPLARQTRKYYNDRRVFLEHNATARFHSRPDLRRVAAVDVIGIVGA